MAINNNNQTRATSGSSAAARRASLALLLVLAVAAHPAAAEGRGRLRDVLQRAVGAGPPVTVILNPVPRPKAPAPRPDRFDQRLGQIQAALNPQPTLALVPFQTALAPLRAPLPQPITGRARLDALTAVNVPPPASPEPLPDLLQKPELLMPLSGSDAAAGVAGAVGGVAGR